jgi:two-component system response regulator WspF
VKVGLLSSDAEQAALLRLLGGDLLVRWQASSIEDARAQLRGRPVDALVAFTGAIRGATRQLRGLGIPVIVVRSGLPSDPSTAYAAMDEGASCVLSLPPPGAEAQRQALLRSLRLAASIPSPPSAPSLPAVAAAPAPAPSSCPLIAVGASTGGPPALAEFLRTLGPVSAAILIVQHIDPTFTGDMAAWLSAESGVAVDLSSDTLQPRPGRAILASTADHLVATEGERLRHAPAAPHEIHHPSVDALFHSLAAHARPGVAVLLTGMGRDGASGLLALRKAGWSTVAQDATAVVDGMPRAARELGAAREVLPLPKIGPHVRRRLGGLP